MTTRGEIVKAARQLKGLSINKVSKLTGISHQSVNLFENDATELNLSKQVILAETLNLPLKELRIKKENIKFINNNISYYAGYIDTDTSLKVFRGKCLKCGFEVFTYESDMLESHRTVCKNCRLNPINNNLTESDMAKLNIMFQNNIVKRSIKLGFSCEITLEDYLSLITKDCYYCGCKPNQEKMINGKKLLHHGLDRKDSNFGYKKENVVPCCKTCNMAKGCLSEKEFLDLVKRISKRH